MSPFLSRLNPWSCIAIGAPSSVPMVNTERYLELLASAFLMRLISFFKIPSVINRKLALLNPESETNLLASDNALSGRLPMAGIIKGESAGTRLMMVSASSVRGVTV